MAAAMLCPPGVDGAPSTQMLVIKEAPAAHGHGGASTHAHDQAAPDAPHAVHDHSDSTSAQDKCTMCAAFCSLTPAPLGQTVLFTPADVASAPSVLISSHPPSFVPGGLERPPRNI
jgi:hypothetical protein